MPGCFNCLWVPSRSTESRLLWQLPFISPHIVSCARFAWDLPTWFSLWMSCPFQGLPLVFLFSRGCAIPDMLLSQLPASTCVDLMDCSLWTVFLSMGDLWKPEFPCVYWTPTWHWFSFQTLSYSWPSSSFFIAILDSVLSHVEGGENRPFERRFILSGCLDSLWRLL